MTDSPTYNVVSYRGTPYPFFAVPSKIDELREIPLKDGDIVIATFPKCGTTVLQQIVLTLLADGNKDVVTNPMEQSLWFEKTVSQGTIESLTSWVPDPLTQGGGLTSELSPTTPRRVLKTHAPSHLSPWKGGGVPDNSKIIIMTRNPADTAISMHHHTLDIPGFSYDGDFDHFLNELFLPGRVVCGCFWEWHGGWQRLYEEENNSERMLLVSYEDFKADPRELITRVANFIFSGQGISSDSARIDAAVESSTFSNMRSNAESVDAKKKREGMVIKKNHIRQGLSGAWRRVFTKEQEEMMEEWHRRKCKEWGLETESFNFL